MHFKLDLNEKKTLMKTKKSGENGTFCFLIRPLPCPFFYFFRRTGHFCLQHLWIDEGMAGKVLPRDQSGVPLMVWKERKRGEPYLSPPSRAECCFWNFLSGIIRRADFFDFLWLCLLYMNRFCGTRRLPQPPLFSLSAGSIWYLTDKMEDPNPSDINRTSLRGWGLDSEGRWLCREGFLLLFALFWPCFSPRTPCCVALRTLLRMCLIFQRSLPAPLSSQKCSPTPHINTQSGFFDSSPHLDQSTRPSATGTHRFLATFDGQFVWTTWICRCELECESGGTHWQDLLGQKDTTEAVWMQSQSESSALPSPRKHSHL